MESRSATTNGYDLTSKAYRRVRATARELAVYAEAVAVARSAGLRWSAPFYVNFYDDGDWGDEGGLTFMHERPVVVLLKSGLPDDELFRLAVHELQHVADVGRGFDSGVLEARAARLELIALARRPTR